MIQILGFRRLAILASLIILNVVMGAALYFYVQPETQRNDRLLRGMISQNSELRGNIDQIQQEQTVLNEQKERFASLQDTGFFGTQDRRAIQNILLDVQEQSGVISAVASVAPADAERTRFADQAKHRIMVSPVSIEIDAYDDVSVLAYYELLKERVPGHIKLETMEIERLRDITPEVLLQIVQGEPTILIRAKLELSWRTLLPNHVIQQVVEDPGEFNDEGGF